MSPDALRLYLVTDPRWGALPQLLRLLPELARAGVTAVQLRDKEATTRALLAGARALIEVARPLGVAVIVNDRADVAHAAGADGVHLGASDLPAEAARRLLGPRAIIGGSVEAVDAPLEPFADADYLAASPVLATATKADVAPPLGLDGVRALRARVARPLVGIGGIGVAEAAAVIAAGADGVAVVSAILGAADPVAATRALRREIDAAHLARRRS